MITISKQDNGVLFTFENSDKYLYGNGTIEVPFNSLSIIADESDMITLKKAASNDVFLSARYDTDLGYRSKDDAIDDLKDMLFAETGGGGSESGITSGEVQTMIDNSLEDYYTDDEVDAALSGKASASDVATLSGQVATKVNTTDFNAYSAATDARLAEDEEVTAAALNDLNDNKADTSAVTQEISAAISGKADTSAVTAVNDALTAHTSDTGIHVSAQEKNAWNAKAEPYSAGTGIEISGNVISATGGGVLVINSEDLMNNMTDDKWDELANALENDIPIFSVIDASGEGTTDIQQFPVNGMLMIDENEGTTEITLNQLFGGGYYDIHIQKNGSEDYSVTGGGGGSYVYYTEDTENKTATIDVQTDDGLGNRSENRVFVDGGDIIIERYNETDDGEGNTGTTDTQVDINSLGLSIITYSDDGIDTTQTELKVQPMGAYVNSEPIATEPYVDAAISGKVDTSAVTAVNDALTAHTANTTVHVTSVEKDAWNAKANIDHVTQSEYDAMVTAGTLDSNTMYIIDDAVPFDPSTKVDVSAITSSITSGSTDSEIPTAKATYDAIQAGGGGGATYNAGTNISIDTANTINCTLPITADSYNNITIGSGSSSSNQRYNVAIGDGATAGRNGWYGTSIAIGKTASAPRAISIAIGQLANADGGGGIAIGSQSSTNISGGVAIGSNTNATGTTKMNLNNQIKVDTNNQVYIKDKTNTTDVCIQDAIAALGGLKLVKLTQAEYDALATKDPDTLYIISNVVS